MGITCVHYELFYRQVYFILINNNNNNNNNNDTTLTRPGRHYHVFGTTDVSGGFVTSGLAPP